MILRTIVADDEELARDEIIFLLTDQLDVDVVGQTANGPETIGEVRRLVPDLLLLDIQMPGLDGFKVLEALSSMPQPPAVVFVTAYNEYAVDAFKVNAIDFILKPVDRERLQEAIQRAAKRIRSGRTEEALKNAQRVLEDLAGPGSPSRRITVRHRGRYLLVDSRAVRYARMKDGQIEVFAEGIHGTANLRSLDELEATLKSPSFFRIHRAYLVNLDHVIEVIPWFSGGLRLRLDDEEQTEVPVSRSKAKVLKKTLKI